MQGNLPHEDMVSLFGESCSAEVSLSKAGFPPASVGIVDLPAS